MNNNLTSKVFDKVQNIQGSTAGAGSGEYHRYKQIQRKERQRMQRMEEEEQKIKQLQEEQYRKTMIAKYLENKNKKNRDKRIKRKLRLINIKRKLEKSTDEEVKYQDNNNYKINLNIAANEQQSDNLICSLIEKIEKDKKDELNILNNITTFLQNKNNNNGNGNGKESKIYTSEIIDTTEDI